MSENRQYMIFAMSEVNQIDFGSGILETSSETLRKSVDGLKSLVKWEGDISSYVFTGDVNDRRSLYL
jgi:hypothetical protein